MSHKHHADTALWAKTLQEAEKMTADDPQKAAELFHEALAGAIKAKAYSSVEELWLNLADRAPEPVEPYLAHAQALMGMRQKDLAVALLSLLIPAYAAPEKAEDRLALLKCMNAGVPDQEDTRNQLEAAYRQIWPDLDQLDTFIRRAGLRGKLPIAEACVNLERFLAFNAGRCVLHYGWGVGVVEDLDTLMGKVTINFQRKPGHVVELETLDSASFQSLDPEDFRAAWALRPAEVKAWTGQDPLRLAKSALRACGGKARAPELKAVLVGTVLEDKTWSSWWSEVNARLKSDAYVEIRGKSVKTYFLRHHPVDLAQQIKDAFNQPPTVPEKLVVWLDWVRSEDCQPELALQLAQQLVKLSDNPRHPDWRLETAYTFAELAVDHVLEGLPEVSVNPAWAQDETIALRILGDLRSAGHRLKWARECVTGMGDQAYALLAQLLLSPTEELRDVAFALLMEAERTAEVTTAWQTASRQSRQYYGPFVWFAAEIFQSERLAQLLKANLGALLESCLQLLQFLDFQARLEQNKEAAVLMRKSAGNIRDFFRGDKTGLLQMVVETMSEALATRIAGRVFHESPLDEPSRKRLLNTIYRKYQQVETVMLIADKTPEEEEAEAAAGPVECLMDSLNQKRTQLRRLIEVEIPANTQAIETARAHGDLRENAEYKAAKEEQRLLQAQARQLESAIDSAMVRNLGEVAGDTVAFGTRVLVRESDMPEPREFVILGPWESNIEVGVLSYQAPLAKAMLGKHGGEEALVELSGRTRALKIIQVEPLRTWPQ